jgi:hypothetical protein
MFIRNIERATFFLSSLVDTDTDQVVDRVFSLVFLSSERCDCWSNGEVCTSGKRQRLQKTKRLHAEQPMHRWDNEDGDRGRFYWPKFVHAHSFFRSGGVFEAIKSGLIAFVSGEQPDLPTYQERTRRYSNNNDDVWNRIFIELWIARSSRIGHLFIKKFARYILSVLRAGLSGRNNRRADNEK